MGAIEQSCNANLTPSGPTKYQYHDSLGRVIRIQTSGFDGDAAGAPAPILYQDTEYNALGQVSRKSNLYGGATPVYWSAFTYDALGRVTREDAPDSTFSTIAYNGLSSTVTNAKGQKKTTLKNAQGQVAQVTDAVGSTVLYAYDALGQLTATNAAGSITKIEYNQRGQKTKMEDPAMGVWLYAYNAFGELVWQRDSLNQTTTMAYDKLGRMTQRNEADLTSQWSYDTNFGGTVACGPSKGKLCQARTVRANGVTDYLRNHTYDALGRIQSTATLLDTTATVSVSYDANTGRVASKTWPTGYKASYGYTAMGYLKTVTGSGGGLTTASYTVRTMDAQRITQYQYGNQIITNKAYKQTNGNLMGIQAGLASAANGVMNQSYEYDQIGNLIQRPDGITNVGETFLYDSLNRLTNYNAVGASINASSPNFDVGVLYDARGNIQYKSDVGQYWYDGQRPNRLTNITLSTPPEARP